MNIINLNNNKLSIITGDCLEAGFTYFIKLENSTNKTSYILDQTFDNMEQAEKELIKIKDSGNTNLSHWIKAE